MEDIFKLVSLIVAFSISIYCKIFLKRIFRKRHCERHNERLLKDRVLVTHKLPVESSKELRNTLATICPNAFTIKAPVGCKVYENDFDTVFYCPKCRELEQEIFKEIQ